MVCGAVSCIQNVSKNERQKKKEREREREREREKERADLHVLAASFVGHPSVILHCGLANDAK